MLLEVLDEKIIKDIQKNIKQYMKERIELIIKMINFNIRENEGEIIVSFILHVWGSANNSVICEINFSNKMFKVFTVKSYDTYFFRSEEDFIKCVNDELKQKSSWWSFRKN